VSHTPFDPNDIIPILKRRKTALLIPFLITMTISISLAFLLPSYYRSSATILIEEQEIPQNLVMATVTSFAEQRLEMIKQRIMSYANLLDLISQHALYLDLKDKWTTEQIIEKMREDIQINTISAEVMDRRTGRPTVATIAFTLSYEGKDPKKVHSVTSALTSLFLEENLKVRTRQTKETTQFFEDEMNKVKGDLDVLNLKLSSFKEKHLLKLPEFMTINMQLLESADKNRDSLNEQLKIMSEREKYYVTQLSLMSPEMEFNSDLKRLEDLKVHLVSLKSKFSDKYPDVINTQSEIQQLQEQLNSGKTSTEKKRMNPDNPTYINITSQLSGVRSEIDSIKRQILESNLKKKNYENRIESSATIEGEYKAYLSEQANLNSKLNDLTQKLMEAKVAYGLEKDQKGERFTLIDPARFPERPFKPKRIVILIIGIILSMGLSIGITAVIEFMDDSIYKPMDLARASQIPVLGEIPLILNQNDLRLIHQRKVTLWLSTILTPIIGLLIFHFFIIDVYVAWAKILRMLTL